MLGLLLPLVVTSVVAALWVGSLAGLQRLRIRWWPLALASIAVQLVLFNPPIDRLPWVMTFGPWIWVLSLVGMLVVLLRNARPTEPARYAFMLAALGVAANLFVVVANGGYMPQSPDARMQARGIPLTVVGAPPKLRNVAPAGAETQLAFLGDVIPQPAWLPTANVVSIGGSGALGGAGCMGVPNDHFVQTQRSHEPGSQPPDPTLVGEHALLKSGRGPLT